MMPNLVCGAVLEAPNEDQARLSEELKRVFQNSDFEAGSTEDLRRSLQEMRVR
jgi:hypothetical protein